MSAAVLPTVLLRIGQGKINHKFIVTYIRFSHNRTHGDPMPLITVLLDPDQ